MREENWVRIKELEANIVNLKETLAFAQSEHNAAATMKKRWGQYTDPSIAEITIPGKPTPLYYYRSNEWISQPFDIPSLGITSYSGPIDSAPPEMYGPGTFTINYSITQFHRKMTSGALSVRIHPVLKGKKPN